MPGGADMLQTILTAIVGIFGPMLGYAGGVRAARLQAQAAERDDDRDDVAANDARWQSMLEHQRAHFEALLAPMVARIDGLETKVSHLEAALDTIRRLYHSAISHIRAWIAWADGPRTTPTPVLPPELREEV